MGRPLRSIHTSCMHVCTIHICLIHLAYLHINSYNIACLCAMSGEYYSCSATHTFKEAMYLKQGKKTGMGGDDNGYRRQISTNLSLLLTFQEETAHLDASEEQTERIQANLPPCKPARSISLSLSLSLSLTLSLSLSLSLPSLPLPLQAGNEEIVLSRGGSEI